MTKDILVPAQKSYLDLLNEASKIDITNLPDAKKQELIAYIDDIAIKAARENFYVFVKLVAPERIRGTFKDGVHIRIICESLQELYENIMTNSDTGRKLQVFLSPESMKTELCTIMFPAWCLGRDPSWRTLAVAHGSKHAAKKLGKPTKDLVRSDIYKRIFPKVDIDRESKANESWNTSLKGGYDAMGCGAQLPGRRGNIILLDDVVSEQTAYSSLERDNINDWVGVGLESRLLENKSGELVVNCLAGDTPVTMADGSWKPIIDVCPGDKVLTRNEVSGEAETKTVEALWPQGKANIYEVYLKNGVIKATDRHPFFVETDEGILEQVKAIDLKPGMKVVRAGVFPVPESNPFSMTPEDCWLLGFMFGDGWVTPHPNSKGSMRYATCFSAGIYSELNERVLVNFERLFGRRPRFHESTRYYRFEVAKAGRWFIEKGLTGGAHGKRVPKWVFSLPEEHRQAFYDGFVDADGHYAPTKAVIIGLCNKNLVTDIKFLAERLGYTVGKIRHTKSTHKPPNSKAAREFSTFWITISSVKNTSVFKTSPVISVTKTDVSEEVYDLSVEGNHNFFALNSMCHNTRWHLDDLSGHLEKRDKNSENPWKIIRIPAILDQETVDLYEDFLGDAFDPDMYYVGGSYWPEHKHVRRLMEKKTSLPPSHWAACYLQNPISEEGGIYKKTYFNNWVHESLPPLKMIFAVFDTAFTEEKTRDSARSGYTIWGVFDNPELARKSHRENMVGSMMLLGAEAGYWSWPELVEKCEFIKGLYKNDLDLFVVENKASGISLVQDLRARGYPVFPYMPDKSKLARAHRAAGVMPGRVFVNPDKMFTKEFMTEVLQFPYGALKDYADMLSMAILFMVDQMVLVPEDYSIYSDIYEDDDVIDFNKAKTYWQAVRSRPR
jgi:phage terminase large subunit-like protein